RGVCWRDLRGGGCRTEQDPWERLTFQSDSYAAIGIANSTESTGARGVRFPPSAPSSSPCGFQFPRAIYLVFPDCILRPANTAVESKVAVDLTGAWSWP